MRKISRRGVLATLPAFMLWPWDPGAARGENSDVHPEFPAQSPERVKEMVGASHGNVDRVRALLSESPALAKATWDWGFGDWETALGAASHVGHREIARLLIEHGARPDLFTFVMLGHLDVVRSYVEAMPGIQRITGPHGLTLLHHARVGGKEAEAVVAYLESVGDADGRGPAEPLSAELRDACVGAYVFGSDQGGGLEVGVRSGTLTIKKRPSGTARGLVHLGELAFHPVGADAVRVRFDLRDGRAAALSVQDGPIHLVATRS